VLRYVYLTLVTAIVILAWGVLNNYFSISPIYMIFGSSMYPTLLEYDLVLTIPKHLLTPESIRVGDIIVFRLADMKIIHRVVAVCGAGCYITKGDNNPAPDPVAVHFDNVLGKVLTVYGNPARVNSIVLVVVLVALDLVRKGVGLRSGKPLLYRFFKD
jgi:signal peptidase I